MSKASGKLDKFFCASQKVLTLKGLITANQIKFPLQGAYVESFRDLIEFEGHMEGDKTMSDYLKTLVDIEVRCEDTVRVMAQGVLELKESHHVDKQTETSIQYFLDRFYMSRISLKMLLNQHIMLFDGTHIPGKNAQIGKNIR